jgi:hypothetical protein
MNAPARTAILYPIFAMVVLVAVVFVRMGRARFGAVRRGEMNPRFYRTYSEGEEPEHLRVITRHFINLFEMPILFYVAVLTTYVTDQVTWWTVACAWTYVVTRYVHSWVHLGSNDVLLRFRVYGTSGLVLGVLWLTILVQLVRHG